MGQGVTTEIKSTGASSIKYGNCEKCHESCSEVFHIIKRRGSTLVFDSFGHKDCFLASRGAETNG